MTFSPQKELQFRTEKSVGFHDCVTRDSSINFPSKRTISEGACTLLYLTMFHHLQPASPKAAPLLAPSPQRVPPLHSCRCCCHLWWKKDICLSRNWGQLLRFPIFFVSRSAFGRFLTLILCPSTNHLPLSRPCPWNTRWRGSRSSWSATPVATAATTANAETEERGQNHQDYFMQQRLLSEVRTQGLFLKPTKILENEHLGTRLGGLNMLQSPDYTSTWHTPIIRDPYYSYIMAYKSYVGGYNPSTTRHMGIRMIGHSKICYEKLSSCDWISTDHPMLHQIE